MISLDDSSHWPYLALVRASHAPRLRVVFGDKVNFHALSCLRWINQDHRAKFDDWWLDCGNVTKYLARLKSRRLTPSHLI
jgi:hypothetical protein